VYVPPDQEFGYDAWCANLRAGRTVHSGGPILSFAVEGRMVGDTVRLPGNGGSVEVEATAESIFPIHALEIVQQGRVVASTEERAGARLLSLRTRLRIDGHTWLAARVGGPGYFGGQPHRDGWGRRLMA